MIFGAHRTCAGTGFCLGARFVGFANKPAANLALGVIVCAVAYALSVPGFLRIRQTAQAAVAL